MSRADKDNIANSAHLDDEGSVHGSGAALLAASALALIRCQNEDDVYES